MHRSVAVIAMLAAVAVAGCASGTTPSDSIPPDADVGVVAKDFQFHPGGLSLSAGEQTTLYFENLDSEPHDIAIFPNKDSSEAMFDGQDIGRGSIVYDIPAFAAGTYFFKCTIHPIMFGDVEVTQ